MCGIVGAVAKRSVVQLLVDGLKKLEYRGYDSAGIAVFDGETLKRIRVAGKVKELENSLQANPFQGSTGIAHTRWATHGIPSEENAHPFISHDELALVHNGIIENHAHLRIELQKAGYHFLSDTDTEVIVHLIHKNFKETKNLLTAVQEAVKQLEGAYALGIISKHHPERLIAVRQGSPLVIGKGSGEHFIASDPLALLSVTQQFIYLEDEDIADICLDDFQIYRKKNQPTHREWHTLAINNDASERGEYRHYMKKEIMEQPRAITNCLEGRIAKESLNPAIFGQNLDEIFDNLSHIQLVACGTSYHAALVARYWFEALTQVPCSVEVASEFRYREMALPKNSLFVTLSQSGETADTLAALRLAKKMDFQSTIAICNVPNSSMVREADHHFLTRAGVEIGVASTKAFTTQLVALLLLALTIRKQQDVIQPLHELPQIIESVLQQDALIARWAQFFTQKKHALFIARGALYPIALEGALKMKEISYIHAEGYPAGELKHGPLALVDPVMPIVSLVPDNALLEKNLSNLQEIRARNGQLFVLTDQPKRFHGEAFKDAHILSLPSVHPLLLPMLYTIPLQLLAYHVAVLKGTDVDQPRNLAKSVTVE